MSGLSIAELVIYIVYLQPALFLLWKHGRRGFLGWFYVQVFCVLRIVGSIIDLIAESNPSFTNDSLLISSIGLSPLVLGAASLLHEARRARNPNLRNKLEWFLVINFHVTVSVSLILIISQVVKIENGTLVASNSLLLKIGVVVVVVCWAILLTWALLSLRLQDHLNAVTYPDGTKLLYGVIAAMHFIGIRMIYGICCFFVTNSNFTSSTVIEVVMSVVPEMLTILIFIFVGIRTRNMWKRRPLAKQDIVVMGYTGY